MAFQRVVKNSVLVVTQGIQNPNIFVKTSFQKRMLELEDFFRRNEKVHIRQAAKELNFSFGKVLHLLRKVLNWKAYKPHVTTVLSHKQRQARVNAAQWFLSHEAEFFS